MTDMKALSFSRRDFVIGAGSAGIGGLASHVLTRKLSDFGGAQAGADPRAAGASSAKTPKASSSPAGQAQANAAAGDQPPLAPPDRQPPDLEVPKATKKLGWAVVGLGELALGEVLPAFAEAKHAKLVALVSGHPDKAKQVAEAYGVDPNNIYSYESFDSIAKNPAIDIVYIILPNSMHAEYTIRSFKAGKHVLCEKPMAPTLEACQQMLAAQREAGKKLMIAYRLHYEPNNRKVIEMCRAKELGELRSFEASNVQDVKAPNIRLSAALAGGPLGDIGIYCINAARYVTGEEPVEVTAMAHELSGDARFREVPAGYVFTMRFPSGVLAHCDCNFAGGVSRRYRAHCEKGYIDLDPAFAYAGLKLRINRDKSTSELDIPQIDQFASEMDHFSEAVMADKAPRTPGEEGLADMRVIWAIEEAARSGRLTKVGS